MGNKKWTITSLIFLLIIVWACGLPTKSISPPINSTSLATILPSAIPSLIPEQVLTGIPTIIESTPVVTSSDSEKSPAPSPTMGKISYVLTPSANGGNKTLQTLVDYNSRNFADQKRTNGDYYDIDLFERPFDDQMNYRGDVDIQKAEIALDDHFYYFTIYLDGIDLNKQNNYGIEIDTNFSGRGNYLIWIDLPPSTTWTVSQSILFMDTNNDVGGKRPIHSDAPFIGNGYDKMLINGTDNISQGIIWTRLITSTTNAVQVAIKQDAIPKKAFMWGVWADGMVKSPSMFDYNDTFTLENAGSPIKDDPNYPLKSLSILDNTCRGVYGRPATGLEPGLCTNTVIKSTPVIITTIIPKITPGNISIP